MVTKNDKEENKVLVKIQGPFQLIAYLLRYRLKEILAVMVIGLIAWILIANVSYTDKGFEWRPSVEWKKK